MPRKISSNSFLENTGLSMQQWFDHLDALGGQDWSRDEFNRYFSDKDLSHWWVNQIVSNYDDDRGIGISGLQKNGLYRIIVTNMTKKSPEVLFGIFMSSGGFSNWVGDCSKETIRIGSEILADDGSVLQIENFDDIGWVKLRRLGSLGQSTTHVSFRTDVGKRGYTRVEITEGNIRAQELVKPYRAFWRNIVDKLIN